MDFEKIQKDIVAISPYIKDARVVQKEGALFAYIYPNLETLEKAEIINIREEIRWYGVELYNIYAKEEEKIKGYEIIIPKTSPKEEPNDEAYMALKSFLATLSSKEVYFDSHIEFDLELDSLDYVQLFVFLEESFSIKIDEALFSKMMRVCELYKYIKQYAIFGSYTVSSWENILKQKTSKKLSASPFVMFLYKAVLYPLFRLYFFIEIKGIENIPDSKCIIAPSHQSMLDGFLIEAFLPYKVLKKTYFLAYKGVFGKNILKTLTSIGQTILIDANKDLKETLIVSSLPLREDKNIIIFPEGARSRDGELLEFRPFFAILAKTFDAPIVPVMIEGTFYALGAGMLFPRPKRIKITFLEPVKTKGASYEEIVNRVSSMIDKELKKERGLF